LVTGVTQAVPVPAWGEYTILHVPQLFNPIAGKNISYSITGLGKVASNGDGDVVLALDSQAGTVTIQRTGRFMLCGSTYIAGSIQNANPDATIDVAGIIYIQIPANPALAPGVHTHELRLGQSVVRLSSLGSLQFSGFSFSACMPLMLPAGTKISLKVTVFADNLSHGQFLNWQTRDDSAAGGANLSIHELSGGT